MNIVQRTGVVYKGESSYAYKINDDWYDVCTPCGFEIVHRSSSDLYLLGPITTLTEADMIDEIYSEMTDRWIYQNGPEVLP